MYEDFIPIKKIGNDRNDPVNFPPAVVEVPQEYRDVAVKVDDAIAGARCWDLARLLDRAAEALEKEAENQPERDR